LAPNLQPLLNPRFFKNGEEIEYSGNVILRLSYIMEIRSVTLEDEGYYTCLPGRSSGCGDSVQQRGGHLLGKEVSAVVKNSQTINFMIIFNYIDN
jgi:hypothetical protein